MRSEDLFSVIGDIDEKKILRAGNEIGRAHV